MRDFPSPLSIPNNILKARGVVRWLLVNSISPGEIKPKDRPTLRLGEDYNMSSYVKGATHLEVTSFAEASRALLYGQRNRKVGVGCGRFTWELAPYCTQCTGTRIVRYER